MADDKKRKPGEEEDGRMSMSGPSMRPAPKPKAQPTAEELKAQERAAKRSQELKRQMVATQHERQAWVTQPRKKRRIERTLAKDKELRNAVFTSVKGGEVAFVSLDPKEQLRVVKGVDKQMKNMARNTAAAMAPAPGAPGSLIPDPTDPLNPYNQANPNSLVNQQQAVQQGIILQEDNLVAEEIQTENNHTMQLSSNDFNDVAAYNAENYSKVPEPSPETGPSNSRQADAPAIKTGERTVEHAGEEKALQGMMDNDKAGLIDGMKGGTVVREASKEAVEHVGMAAAKVLLSGA